MPARSLPALTSDIDEVKVVRRNVVSAQTSCLTERILFPGVGEWKDNGGPI